MKSIVPDPAMAMFFLHQADRAARQLLKFKGTPGVDHGKNDLVVLRGHSVPAHPLMRKMVPFFRGADHTITGSLRTDERGGIEWMKFNQVDDSGSDQKQIALARHGTETWVEMVQRQGQASWHIAFRHDFISDRVMPLEDNYQVLGS